MKVNRRWPSNGMAVVVVDGGPLLPILRPPVPGDLAVVFVDLDVAALPVVELAGVQANPAQRMPSGQLGALGPVVHVIDDLVADGAGSPSSPSEFPKTLVSWNAPPIGFMPAQPAACSSSL